VWDASAGRAATVFNVFCETFWSRIAGSIGRKIDWMGVATTTNKVHWEVQLMFLRENVRAWAASSPQSMAAAVIDSALHRPYHARAIQCTQEISHDIGYTT
jgi:hypothetical protein